MQNRPSSLKNAIGSLLCKLGVHDFRILEASFGFGGTRVHKLECKRCGLTVTRRSQWNS